MGGDPKPRRLAIVYEFDEPGVIEVAAKIARLDVPVPESWREQEERSGCREENRCFPEMGRNWPGRRRHGIRDLPEHFLERVSHGL